MRGHTYILYQKLFAGIAEGLDLIFIPLLITSLELGILQVTGKMPHTKKLGLASTSKLYRMIKDTCHSVRNYENKNNLSSVNN